MKTSIATVSIAGTFREKLEAIAAAGFDGVEIFEQDFLASEYSPQDLGTMVRDMGLAITLFQPFRDFEGLPEPARGRAFARARRKFDLMNEMGADLILMCSSVHPLALGGIDRAAEDFHALGEIAASQGIKLGYEALAWGRHINDHRDAWEVVRRADHPNVGIILDSFHTLGRKIDPSSIRRIPGDKIFFVQLADAPAIEMDLLYWSRHFRNMPGEGDLPVAGFLADVLATGYNGPLSLEVFNDQFRAGSPRLVAQDGLRSLIALEDQARRLAPELAPSLPQLPKPQEVEEIEFLEFVAQDEEKDKLCTFLTSAGFIERGRHRSKDVTLWQQGTARILVNAQKEGFAHSVWVSRGTSVSELALRVKDAKAVQQRAIALRAAIHHEPHEARELDIPAIRGMGGMAIRLTDQSAELSRLWDVDFQLSQYENKSEIKGIDHIAQTMDYAEMLSWSLFYTSLFDAEKSPIIDVVDPHGLVRSQALKSGALRITLNGAEARQTLAARFIHETFGANVQHIAISSDDILTTAARCAACGFPVLPIGDNYYADLEARFGLAPEKLAQLQRYNILYDEDGSGGFYQFYSQLQTGGFFLEYIQRVDGYDGYGGPNAPFRIAALKRLSRPSYIPKN